jgi:hypothetical protein
MKRNLPLKKVFRRVVQIAKLSGISKIHLVLKTAKAILKAKTMKVQEIKILISRMKYQILTR